MSSPEIGEAVARASRVQRIIWIAMMVAVPVYVAIVSVLGSRGSLPAGPPSRTVALVLTLYAAVVGIVSFFVERLMLPDSRLQALLGVGPGADPSAARPSSEEQDRRLITLLPTQQTAWIARLALAESVAIIGFVLCFMGMDRQRLYPFAAAAFLLVALARPNPERFVERARALMA